MIASHNPCSTTVRALNTACPRRRAFVASDARRRGQAFAVDMQHLTAFGAALTTPAMLAGVDNARCFAMIVNN
jgi:hypothetical protein